MLSRKRSRVCAYADDNSPLVVQDVDLSSPLAFELSHAENHAPNRFEIGRQVTLAAQPRAISADQAEFIIRHCISSSETPSTRQSLTRTKVPPRAKYFRRLGRPQKRRPKARVSINRSPLSPLFGATCDRRKGLG